jgi:hypothetical protein
LSLASRQLYRFLPSFVAVSICHPHPPSFSLILSLYLAFEESTFIVALQNAIKGLPEMQQMVTTCAALGHP